MHTKTCQLLAPLSQAGKASPKLANLAAFQAFTLVCGGSKAIHPSPPWERGHMPPQGKDQLESMLGEHTQLQAIECPILVDEPLGALGKHPLVGRECICEYSRYNSTS